MATMSAFPIVLACANIDDLEKGPADFLQDSELRRAEQFKLRRRRQEYLGGRILLRLLLERFTGCSAASHRIEITETGKPVCPGGPAISIAHNGDTVVCAVTDNGLIGIDIELPPQPRDAIDIAKRFFSEEEATWVIAKPEERFLLLWVLKEAWLKAIGSGLSGGLDSLQCDVVLPDIAARIHNGEIARLSLCRRESAFIGLATTVTPHDSVLACRWDHRANGLVEDSELRRVAATRRHPAE